MALSLQKPYVEHADHPAFGPAAVIRTASNRQEINRVTVLDTHSKDASVGISVSGFCRACGRVSGRAGQASLGNVLRSYTPMTAAVALVRRPAVAPRCNHFWLGPPSCPIATLLAMELPVWFVNAFTSRPFAGNPAAVIPLQDWLPEPLMLAIARENDLSETAYLVGSHGQYEIRWFTPTTEVPLCGHATLASAWVLFNRVSPGLESVCFASKSGPLGVTHTENRLVLDFPASSVQRVALASETVAGEIVAALGREPAELHAGFQWLAVYRSETEVRNLAPDFDGLLATGIHGIIATAPGDDSDFVSRFFAPAAGVPEDPVTGSAHTRLVPYWSARLSRKSLFARQVSARGGELWCELRGDRVHIAGDASLYLEGTLRV